MGLLFFIFGGKASCTRALNFFMSSLYKCNAFIPVSEAKVIVSAGRHFLEGYARLALLSWRLNQPRFPLIPKCHMLYHVVHYMSEQSSHFPAVENPMTANCSMDEDFIGRFCKLTRAVNPRLRIVRSYQRYFSQVQLLWLKAPRE